MLISRLAVFNVNRDDDRQMEIWDLHCHLSGVPGNTPEARLGKLIEYAGRMGVTRQQEANN